jgi:hypothetical protein
VALDIVALKALAIEMAAAIPPAPPASANDSWMPKIAQTGRARALRRIQEIAQSRGWQLEVLRALDRHEVTHIDDLEDEAVFQLRDRMEYFEDCVQTCCDPDDAPPAR